ncbi:efflux RND transporter periplasmic adaptor subunit [Aeromonas veronii]|uniref:Efflux transporter periplasmic adaptor subunit n=1 Tax=Aeromonas veronii TaxID=654 RepID=A0ABY3MNL3_AERVE|nr:efflux RND transporter periplasmic adaptor subunit [Aeromonas veronii]RDU85270.1 efflux transporter periplasmic adaptor subunit [Aeromonas veronii]RDU86105.1 efflux transporter periplasmic adaptor subunit [Aeromonas veronii]RDU86384.1 efflux transporter periplasmic adaptor subunit [Aeromonas veronii]RDU94371.1 efflux transporter periplasmic adaptor subunit [Aeromonas veronii]TEY53427.1 efflux transporter periplasmic adaptor subunit [Aeromonas veronii]
MKRGWLWWGSGAVVAAAALAWWWQPQPTPIRLAEVGRGDVLVTVVNTRAGTIKSCQRAGLSLPGGGVVEQIAVKAGERVARGDLLLTLWSDDIHADLARARAQQALGKTQREERCSEAAYYEREANRLGTLLAKNLTSRTLAEQAQNLADTRRYVCQASRQQERVDEAQVAQVEARLSERRLLAPFAGVVAEVNSKLGEYMTPSPPGVAMPPVIDLIDDRCLYVSAPIDEVDAARLKVGQSARVLLDAMPGRDFAATVTRIAPYVKELEKQARTVEVEAALTALPTDVPLLIGYSADLEVEVTRATEVLRVAASSRADDGSVLRLEGDKLVRVVPRWGVENWNWIEVVEGLAAGDRLAAQPGQIVGEGPFSAATEQTDE